MESSPSDQLVVTDFKTQTSETILSTLDEIVLNFAISPAGKIILSDYYNLYEYILMGAGGRDLGSVGITLLVPTMFVNTSVSRIAILEKWENCSAKIPAKPSSDMQ
ncbi:hypothetical protein BTUL_0124g00310 [Botrytis tulipae]|uniref:Uncharacterized protein n=1 Tax=Botrytis tulipae TaxID=87230 RepID=A0A4Z1EJX1_9HELO|nr:hypothetical protein BTUL_0124g00310 [Botrytis tulipae]